MDRPNESSNASARVVAADQLEEPFPRIVLIGAAIVSGAGIFVILRERQLGIDRARQSEASAQRAL